MKPCFSKRYKDQLRTFGIIAEPSAYEYIVNISSLYKYHLTRFSLSLFQWFYTVTKDNTLLHCEIQNSVLPHRKQSWICVWHFLSIIQTYSTWQMMIFFVWGEWIFCVRYSTLTAIIFWLIWSPDIFLFHYFLILDFLFFVCSNICRIIQFTDQNWR